MDEKQKKLKLLKLDKEELALIKSRKSWLFFNDAYSWQKDTWALGRFNKQRLLKAGNQVGKTTISCIEVIYHLTGLYPEGWAGYRFQNFVNLWVIGVSYKKLRTVLQKRLLGELVRGEFTGNLIPVDKILHETKIWNSGLKESVNEIKIKYKTKGVSTLSFFSAEQHVSEFMSGIVDFALFDEEPRNPLIYPEVVMRTINGDHKRGGLTLLSFTPQYGTTEIVEHFTNNIQPNQAMIEATWDECTHFTEERKKAWLASLPPHERDMRSKGMAQRGTGAIYPFLDKDLYDDITSIPDHWARLGAIDFGLAFTGLVWGAWDKDTDVLHIYHCMKIEEEKPAQISLKIRAQGEWIPMAWPHDGHIRERKGGVAQKNLYTAQKVKMLPKHATDKDGTISVEAGIMRLYERMRDGRLKVARHLEAFFKEKRSYYRTDDMIIKSNDHIMDALRYLEMMLRYAKPKYEAHAKLQPNYIPKRFKR